MNLLNVLLFCVCLYCTSVSAFLCMCVFLQLPQTVTHTHTQAVAPQWRREQPDSDCKPSSDISASSALFSYLRADSSIDTQLFLFSLPGVISCRWSRYTQTRCFCLFCAPHLHPRLFILFIFISSTSKLPVFSRSHDRSPVFRSSKNNQLV